MGQHKCEHCGKIVTWRSRKERGKLAAGWVGTGGDSKYGNAYDRRGFRWWCTANECRQAKLTADVETVFSNAPQHVKNYILAEMLLDRARRN